MERFHPQDSRANAAAVLLCAAAVFCADAYTPLGIAVWVFYLAPVAMTLLAWRPNRALVTAAWITVLIVVGFFISQPGIAPQIARLNRSFGVATVWIVAAVSWYFIRAKLTVRRQEWLQSGQGRLSERMAGEQSITALGDSILRALGEYLQAQAGAIYIQENGHFRRVATYGVPADAPIAERFLPGDGLLGEAVRNHQAVVIDDVPPGYFTFGSGLGQGIPRHLLIAPAVIDGAANTVVELGFLQPVDSTSVELLRQCSEAIALTVRSAKYRARQEELLEETQRQAEELQAQSEELRASNEELEQQSRVLQESQLRLEQQQAELEQSNAQLEEQTQVLESQRDELLLTKRTLENQARELEQASRYKSDFLASMSHELRTPLNSALILARLLFENRTGNLTAEQVEYARTIEASGNALLELINDVLDLAKVEAGRMEMRLQTVPLARLTDGLRATFEPVAQQKGIAFHVQIRPDVPEVIETDPQRLEQVLKNLLSNAIKFTEQGSVTLGISRAPGSRLALAVSDTGIGIPAEHQEAVFEPFRQIETPLTRKYNGTGLGLSISRELMRLLGGEIQLHSTAGQGSVFTVLLPERQAVTALVPALAPARPFAAAAAATGHTEQAAPPVTPANSATAAPAPAAVADDRDSLSGERHLILIVEDDEVFAYILRDLAHEMRFQCVIAHTAAAAADLIRRYSPHAVILDIGLPDNSGLALLDRLKQDSRTRHLPVHIVSLHDHTGTALALGAVGYALKPVKREQLLEALQRLQSRLARRERRVLVVEDDPVQSESIGALLASAEVETVHTRTAAACLEQLQANSFDCMVLDLSLPDATGLTLLETISREERYSFPPVIVYTGRDLTQAEEELLRRYSHSIIIKGAKSPERLLDEVTLFLHQVVSELPPEKQRLLQQARSRDAVLEGRRILLVEDDVRNVFALTSLLEPKGVTVEIARNGREALEILEQSAQDGPPAFDLVLMDVMMPEMDGLTATREIRRRQGWNRIPIIALTAKAMKNDQEHILAAGANDYLAKPLDVDQLLSLVRVWMPR